MKKIFGIISLAPLTLFAQQKNTDLYGNPPCYFSEAAFGAEFLGDALYIQPLIDSLSYAIRSDIRQQTGVNTTPGGPILDLKPEWQPAFRVSVSYVPSLTLRLVWMHFLGRSSAHSHADLSLPGIGLEGTWVPPVNSLVLYSKASFNWALDFDTVDLELGKCYQVSAFLRMNPACSLRVARINQLFRAHYNSDHAEANNDFLAIGPRIGLDSEWSFLRNWALYSRAVGSILYGQFETQYEFSSSNASLSPGLRKVSSDFYFLVPNVEFSFGIGWQKWLSNDHCRLGFRLSYEAQVFWNQIQFRQLLGSDAPFAAFVQPRDLSMQAFALRGQFAF